MTGQQEIQCKLQGYHWRRFPYERSSGGGPVSHDAGTAARQVLEAAGFTDSRLSSGIQQAKKGFSRWVSLFTEEQTAASWFTT